MCFGVARTVKSANECGEAWRTVEVKLLNRERRGDIKASAHTLFKYKEECQVGDFPTLVKAVLDISN